MTEEQTRKYIEEEMVADYLGDNFKNFAEIQKLFTKQSTWEKFKDLVKSVRKENRSSKAKDYYQRFLKEAVNTRIQEKKQPSKAVAYSKNFENLDGIDANNKNNFINEINKIVNSNLSGFLEIENLNLNKLSKLIKGHLDYINTNLPILINKSKLRKNFKSFDSEKHYHGMEADVFYNALNALNDPEFMTQNVEKPNEITIVTSVELYNKVLKQYEKVTIAFDFNFTYKSKEGKSLINLIKTSYGMNLTNQQIYLAGGKPNNRKVIYEKRRGWLAPIAPSTSSNYNVNEESKNVNKEKIKFSKFSNEVEIELENSNKDSYIKAKKEFGTTYRLDYAGWLNVDGSMLDFSEGQGYRVQDHREIQNIYKDNSWTDALIQYLAEEIFIIKQKTCFIS